MDEPDYSSFSLDELYDVQRNIDARQAGHDHHAATPSSMQPWTTSVQIARSSTASSRTSQSQGIGGRRYLTPAPVHG